MSGTAEAVSAMTNFDHWCITPSQCFSFGFSHSPGCLFSRSSFSLVNEASLWSVIDKWQHELVRHAPNVPVVLVGTHADIRESISPSSASVFSRKAIQKLHQRNLHLTHLPPATIVPEILQKVGAPRDHDVKVRILRN